MEYSNKDPFLKSCELYIKKKLKRLFIKNIMPIIIDSPQQIFKGTIRKILLLRQDRIGDLLVSVPTLKLLRKYNPNLEIEILLSKKNAAAVDSIISYIDNYYIYDKKIFSTLKLLRKLRSKKYDLIIDMYDNVSSTSNFLLKFSNAKESLGFQKAEDYFCSYLVPLPSKREVHIVDRIAQLLLPFGIEPAKEKLELEYKINENLINQVKENLGENISKIMLGINLSGSSKAKFWGTDNYILFINELKNISEQIEVILFYTRDYLYEASLIIANTSSKAAPLVETFNEYAAMLSTCSIILTPDTAAVHLASAFQIPCICLFQVLPTTHPNYMLPWTPYKTPYKALAISGALGEITVSDVIDAFKEITKIS